jgi:tetratricopeptide (TPR) repeat protein
MTARHRLAHAPPARRLAPARLAVCLLAAALAPALTACGGASRGAAAATTPRPERRAVIQMEELHIAAGGDGVEGLGTSYDAAMLFDRATALLNSQRCDDAVALYLRLAREFPASRLVSSAHYNAGLCLEDTGRLPEAAERFEAVLAAASPDPRDALHAHLMLSNLYVRLERYDDAIRLCDAALARTTLDPDERVELMARKAQAHIGARRLAEAERAGRDALSYWRRLPEDSPVRDLFYVAAANFVVAETLRERAEGIGIPQASVEQQRQALEDRARVLLDAQREYFNTIRIGHAHWAAASGYRIGQMYDAFWTVISTAPVPPRPDLSPDLYRVFSEEYHRNLREMVKPLLQHAVRYWEMTLLMVERTGARSEWSDRARRDLDRVRQALLAGLPGAPPPAPAAPAPAAPTSAAPGAARSDAPSPGSRGGSGASPASGRPTRERGGGLATPSAEPHATPSGT